MLTYILPPKRNEDRYRSVSVPHLEIQADPHIRGFSIGGLPRPEKKWKIKEINGS